MYDVHRYFEFLITVKLILLKEIGSAFIYIFLEQNWTLVLSF